MVSKPSRRSRSTCSTHRRKPGLRNVIMRLQLTMAQFVAQGSHGSRMSKSGSLTMSKLLLTHTHIRVSRVRESHGNWVSNAFCPCSPWLIMMICGMGLTCISSHEFALSLIFAQGSETVADNFSRAAEQIEIHEVLKSKVNLIS